MIYDENLKADSGSVRMFQAIVDSRLLEAVSSWLEPMRPSGSLPAEGIQKAIFEVLPRVRSKLHPFLRHFD